MPALDEFLLAYGTKSFSLLVRRLIQDPKAGDDLALVTEVEAGLILLEQALEQHGRPRR